MRSTRRSGLAVVVTALFLFLGCGHGSSSSAPAVQAPGAFLYGQNPAVYTLGSGIAVNTPIGGSASATYAISPALPAGLSLALATGAISGTPDALSPATTYTVTATDSAGSTMTSLVITVEALAPAKLAYATAALVCARGTAIAPDNPSSTGGAVTDYSISPALPPGLSLDAHSGIISGTPSAVSPSTAYQVTATDSGGSTSTALAIVVFDTPPAGLTYASGQAIYTKGVAIAPNAPSSSGGAVTTYTVSPALPAGLNLSATGIISGTPVSLSPTATYTVTATDSGGSTTGTLVLTVNDVAPAGLAYPVSVATFTKGLGIQPESPAITGGPVVAYSVSPALPAGLSLDPGTGVLSGTPLTLSPGGVYQVTATNSGGTSSAALTLTVLDVAPSGLTYASSSAAYTRGASIPANSPFSSGGTVTAYAISPALPAGLSLNTTTGVITGTPTGLSTTPVTYTVTATNSGGSTTGGLTLTVDDIAPAGLTYPGNPAVYTRGSSIQPNTPSIGGGPATSYTINPPLPPGLTLNATTGVLGGSPSGLSAAVPYTVTASNSGGSTTGFLVITVNDVAPAGLVYPSNPAVYTNGTSILPNSPSCGGGAITSYSISPALPLGLAMGSTGVITGTPTGISASATYTVTATNTGGSTSALLQLAVNDIAPSGLSYATGAPVYTKGTPITPNTPSISGGAVTGYTISPTLPTGLSLASGTGVISGNPTMLAPVATYTVTATNSGGSISTPLQLTVNDLAPSGLSYATGSPVYTKGMAITPNVPSISGGVVTGYTISPALPPGLSLGATSGQITGTPTVLSTTPVVYTVTATNSGGTTTAVVNLTVNDVPPSALNYATLPLPATFTQNASVGPFPPSISGGPVVSYAVVPPLPTGLTLNSLGAISGTPTTLTTVGGYAVTATNSGGSTTAELFLTVVAVAPSAFTYTFPASTYAKGTTITNNTPIISGGPVLTYTISPALPAGLSLTTAGVITGTPTQAGVSPQTAYTVTATNSGGSTTAPLSIQVNDIAPSGLTYPGYASPYLFTNGTAITSLPPTLGGGGPVVSYSGSLPQGLQLNASTGVISGTPTAVSGSTPFTVTATNSGGSTSLTLTMQVNDVPPSGFSYHGGPAFTFTNGTAIASLPPTISGGAVVNYAVSPSLPAGLSLSATTGVIAGTPTAQAVSPLTPYTVTATNSGGFTTATLNLTVNDLPPTNLSYQANPAVYAVVYNSGPNIAANVPSNAGGKVTGYTISPALPPGLSLGATSGQITGAPSAVSPLNTYTVTATNSGGSTTATLTLTVNDAPPASWFYSPSSAAYTLNLPSATPPTPSGTGGGAVVSYSVSPSLPAGLSLNTTTGVITGSPTALSTSQLGYTVTATNSGGSATATVDIAIYDAPSTELLLPLSAHPGDTWMAASLPAQVGMTYSWSSSPSGNAQPALFFPGDGTNPIGFGVAAMAGSNAVPIQVQVQNLAGATVNPTQTVTVQTGTSLVENGGAATGRTLGTATLLATGRVFVAGGTDSQGTGIAGTELFDPLTGVWFSGPLATVPATESVPTATLLQDGTVLLAGLASQVYNPQLGTCVASSPMGVPRYRQTATLLADGSVLAAGGVGTILVAGQPTTTTLSSAERYTAQAWAGTGSLQTARCNHTATLLGNGSVLVAGGLTNLASPTSSITNSAELFTYASGAGTWSPLTQMMVTARSNGTSTLLPSGKVLVAGGITNNPGSVLAAAEIYDPVAQTWTSAGALGKARANHSATLLPSGKVLVTGGETASGMPLASAELYNPATNTWTPIASMTEARFNHMATLLPSGKVLVAGGTLAGSNTTSISEIYDPVAGTWSPTAKVGAARTQYTATLLPSGKVLVAGGSIGGPASPQILNTAYLYDPTDRSWTATGNLTAPRYGHTATLLASGKVLVAGGNNGLADLSTAELFDPSTQAWSATAQMGGSHYEDTAILLPNGNVLVAGGTSLAGGTAGAYCEIYDANQTPPVWSGGGNLILGRKGHTATLLPATPGHAAGQILVAGGVELVNGAYLGEAEVVDIGSTSWTATNPMMSQGMGRTATLLPVTSSHPSGQVLVAGGMNTTNGSFSASELYDPIAGTWTPTGGLANARALHTATLLTDGSVLVTGGASVLSALNSSTSTSLASSELYTPSTGAWTASGSLVRPRDTHTATLLADNASILIAFGNNGDEVTEIMVP